MPWWYEALKDVWRHHVPIRADHTKDHDRVRKLSLHHSGHIIGANSNPLMVLPVVGLVLAEILLIREEPQHIGLLWVLQLVEELGGVKQPSVLGCLGQKLASLHSVAFAAQILVYTLLNCPFINPQFRSHGSHGLGGVNVDHGLNPFDKICISQLLAVIQRLWRSCDNSTVILTFLQLLTSTLDGSHVDPEGVGNSSVVHFTTVENQGHDHGTSHFCFSELYF